MEAPPSKVKLKPHVRRKRPTIIPIPPKTRRRSKGKTPIRTTEHARSYPHVSRVRGYHAFYGLSGQNCPELPWKPA